MPLLRSVLKVPSKGLQKECRTTTDSNTTVPKFANKAIMRGRAPVKGFYADGSNDPSRTRNVGISVLYFRAEGAFAFLNQNGMEFWLIFIFVYFYLFSIIYINRRTAGCRRPQFRGVTSKL